MSINLRTVFATKILRAEGQYNDDDDDCGDDNNNNSIRQ
jgi:hypothetical protein